LSTSSKTPSSETAKTKWGRRFLVVAEIVAAVTAAIGLTVFTGQPRAPHTATLHTANKQYNLRVAATAQQQEKGLGDIASMPENSGMLFWFTDDKPRCFWMKDMHFPLDIIWVDAAHRVTHVQPHISPATYPNAFCPPAPARYVIELNSGEAARAGLQRGETLTF